MYSPNKSNHFVGVNQAPTIHHPKNNTSGKDSTNVIL